MIRAFVDAKAFGQALERVSKVIRKSLIPVLETVCIRFTGDRCVLTATDMESWFIDEIPAYGDDFTCAFYHIKDAVKVCRFFDGELTVSVADKNDDGRSERYIDLMTAERSARFEALSADEVYPTPMPMAEAAVCKTTASSLLRRINKVSYANLKRGGSDDYQGFSCVQLKGAQVYTLDGLRAAWDTDPTMCISPPALVPATALAHLKLLGDEEITIFRDKKTMQFAGKTARLICRIVESVPFDLNSSIPGIYKDKFDVRPKDFLRELDYLKGVMPPKGPAYAVLSDGSLYLMCYPGRCATRLQMAGTCETRFAFDINFMADALKQFSGEEWVRIKVSGRNTPIVIEAEGRTDHALILPVRLRDAAAA